MFDTAMTRPVITRDYPTHTDSEPVSDLSKADLIVLMQDMRAADLTFDMEVIAACEKWGIYPDGR